LPKKRRRLISQRTKDALARSTKKLGGLRPGTIEIQEEAMRRAEAMAAVIGSIDLDTSSVDPSGRLNTVGPSSQRMKFPFAKVSQPAYAGMDKARIITTVFIV
jgi:hypothetical protein